MARPGLQVHPKFRRLVHTLGEPVPHVLGYLECMWLVGYESGNPILGDRLDVELAAQYPGKPGALCQALLDCRFLDPVPDSRFQIHDLLANAPGYVEARARREEERNKAKNCERCGVEFHSPETHAKYCSPACRQASYRGRTHDGVTHGDEGVRNNVTRVTERYEPPAPAPAPAPAPITNGVPFVCSEPGRPASEPAVPDPVVMTFPTVGKGGKEWHLREPKLAEYRESYPGVDVLAQCRSARQWCIDNAPKRKTARGMPAFLSRWLAKEQDRGGTRANPSGEGAPHEDGAAYQARMKADREARTRKLERARNAPSIHDIDAGAAEGTSHD